MTTCLRASPLARGFTLIELLVTVAIISILAAIAMPNYIDAQVRSKVSRVKADFKALQMGLESYYADHSCYVSRNREGEDPDSAGSSEVGPYYAGFAQLTSPVAYLSTIPHDPMGRSRVDQTASGWRGDGYGLGTGEAGDRNPSLAPWDVSDVKPNCWELESDGPDRWDDTQGSILGTSAFPWPGIADVDDLNLPWTEAFNAMGGLNSAATLLYDPTNGTVSMGEIMRFGGQRPAGRVYQYFWETGAL